MPDLRLDRLAAVAIRYSTQVRRGDLVTIVGEPTCMAAVEALFKAILQAGGHPSFHPRSERLQELLLRHGSDDQIRHVSPFEAHRLAKCDVLIVVSYPLNTNYLGGIDPARAAMAQAARCEMFNHSLQRGAAGELRYLLVEIPGDAAAQDAGMSLSDYEELVYRANFLHLADPVAAWQSLHQQQAKAIEFLAQKTTLRFRAPEGDGKQSSHRYAGTDLTVDVSGRTWINCAGAENLPDGEVFTGPRGVDGVVNFSFPAVYRGQEVDGIRLAFRDGRVVDASAAKNEAFLIALLDQDAGARNVGEIALGTNYGLTAGTKNPLFDEKIGGTFHLAVGAGFPETGNSNQSGLHWDLVCDLRQGGEIFADGELVSKNGRFLIPGWPGN